MEPRSFSSRRSLRPRHQEPWSGRPRAGARSRAIPAPTGAAAPVQPARIPNSLSSARSRGDHEQLAVADNAPELPHRLGHPDGAPPPSPGMGPPHDPAPPPAHLILGSCSLTRRRRHQVSAAQGGRKHRLAFVLVTTMSCPTFAHTQQRSG